MVDYPIIEDFIFLDASSIILEFLQIGIGFGFLVGFSCLFLHMCIFLVFDLLKN